MIVCKTADDTRVILCRAGDDDRIEVTVARVMRGTVTWSLMTLRLTIDEVVGIVAPIDTIIAAAQIEYASASEEGRGISIGIHTLDLTFSYDTDRKEMLPFTIEQAITFRETLVRLIFALREMQNPRGWLAIVS